MKRIRIGAMAGAALAATLACSAPVGALHDPDVDDGELGCQQSAATAVARFMKAKTGCLINCWRALGRGDPRDCEDTFRDGDPRDAETQACIDRAEGKALARYARSCTGPACPECPEYWPCTADGNEKVATAEVLVDLYDGLVRCDDASSDDGRTPAEGACQDAIAASLGRLPAEIATCTNGCIRAAHRGAERHCAPDGARDARSEACIAAAQARCVARIDAGCADLPECLGEGPVGASLCGFVRAVSEGQYREYYCAE
jgi:hypothetical protein